METESINREIAKCIIMLEKELNGLERNAFEKYLERLQ
jgi:hypothetical protein